MRSSPLDGGNPKPEEVQAPWEDRERGVSDPRAQVAYLRMRADLDLLANWRTVGLERAAIEACERWGHLRPRAGMCDRCGQGVPRSGGNHSARGDEPRFGASRR